MFRNKSIKKYEINYSYSDANLIPQMNKYLMESSLKLKLIKLAWDIQNARIKIIFKSDFEVRRLIADKLRELDSDSPAIRMKRQCYLSKEALKEEEKRYSDIIELNENKESEEITMTTDDNERLHIGDTVVHFKGNKYLILEFAKHSETKESMVIYQALYGDKQVWVRPQKMFNSKVNKKKYPDATQEYRFEKYDPSKDTSMDE
jgi:hypothetical protein